MSNVLSIATIGDLHYDKKRLDAVLGDLALSLMNKAIRMALDKAIEAKVDVVVFLGDIGDMPTLSDKAELEFQKILKEYDEKDVYDIDVILGNHDVEQKLVNSLCKLQHLSDTGYFKRTRVYSEYSKRKLKGVTLEYLPFPLKKAKVKHSIAFGHFERPGTVLDNGHPVGEGHGVEEEKGTSYYVLGHLHTCQTVGRSYYPGTLYQTSFGERPDKFMGFYKARIKDGKLEFKANAVPFDSPFKLINLEVKSLKDLNKISKDLTTKYRILYNAKLEIPRNLMLKNPNVIEVLPYKDKVELSQLLKPETVTYSVTDNLTDFLEKDGLSPKQIKRALKLVEQVPLIDL